jgi:hypothetical protein
METKIEQQKNGQPYILYKSMISDDLREEILNYYNKIQNNLEFVKGSSVFPLRRQLRELPDELAMMLMRELYTSINGYFTKFIPNGNNIRIYQSNYGIVLPHKDVATYQYDTHTCLIYLTDEFTGGVLSVKIPRTNEHIEEYGEKEKKHLNITPEPRMNYGIIFSKRNNTLYK